MNPLIIAASEKRRKGLLNRISFLGKPLIKGTVEHGYYGKFTAEEIITGDALAALTGLTQGNPINSDAGFLGFSLNGKTLLVARKAFRNKISWDQINAVGLSTGKHTTINGVKYVVRLFKGALNNPSGGANGHDVPATHGSEWNRLMYHVASIGTMTSEGISTGDFDQLSDDDLGLVNSNGQHAWCQERRDTSSNVRVTRGGSGVDYFDLTTGSAATTNTGYGWRPVLELVE